MLELVSQPGLLVKRAFQRGRDQLRGELAREAVEVLAGDHAVDLAVSPMGLANGKTWQQRKALPAQRGHDAGRDVLPVHKLPRLEQRLGAPQQPTGRIEREPE